MITKVMRSSAMALGLAALAALPTVPPASAEGTCPCFTSAQIDEWYAAMPPYAGQPRQTLACVDDPGFITYDYLDRSAATPSAIYVDLMYRTTNRPARCLVDRKPKDAGFETIKTDIRNVDALACRDALRASRAWQATACPNN